MLYTMDKLEKILSPAEEAEKEEMKEEEQKEDVKQLEEDREEEAAAAEEEDGDEKEEESRDSKEKEESAKLESAEDTEKKLPVQRKNKKQPEVLNLNNEVVKMRKEVKRLRALISRKLTRQITALKKKKGKETEIERNQKRAARLLEEIHAMKILSPDLVTKTALQKNLSFEQVCKNPKSTISDRALTRIATHPQFSKKIEEIKAAVKAFKEERMKGLKQEKKGKGKSKDGKVNLRSPGTGERKAEEEEEAADDDNNGDSGGAGEHKETADTEESDGSLKNTKHAAITKYEKDTRKANSSADSNDDHAEIFLETKPVGQASAKNRQVKDILKNNPKSQSTEINLTPKVLQSKKNQQESDVEESDEEEKEYFDDSTEERFHKQSSQSEESDSDDDFFLGKVSKFKNKKKSVEGELKKQEVKVLSTEKTKASDQVQNELEELESRLKSKVSMQSVFCSLSGSKPGAARAGNTFWDRGKQRGSGLNRDFSKQSKFQKQDKGIAGISESRRPASEERGFTSTGRGRGRGRGDGSKQNDRRSGGVPSHQPPQLALHPSWEASKKRKEQQGQILAFQGKKIKFDDDD